MLKLDFAFPPPFRFNPVAQMSAPLMSVWKDIVSFTYCGTDDRAPIRSREPRLFQPNIDWHFERTGKDPDRDLYAYRQCRSSPEALYSGFAKFNRRTPVPDIKHWNCAELMCRLYFAPFLSGARVLSHEESCEQVDDRKVPGWPYNQVFLTKGEAMASAVVQAYIRDCWEYPWRTYFFQSSVKIEMRLATKIASNALRVFLQAPLEHVVNTNRLCWHLNQMFYNTANVHWGFPGATKYRGGWHKLYMKLSAFSHPFEQDQKAYDQSLSAYMLRSICELRIAFMSAADRSLHADRLRALYAGVINSVVVLMNGDFVMKHRGMPSGCSNTIVDNTILLFQLFCYAWCVLSPDRAWNRLGVMLGHVVASLCGDDNTGTISGDVFSWFNPISISRVWSSLGIITHEAENVQRLLDCTFMSMKFKMLANRMVVSVPDYQRVMCSLVFGPVKGRHPRLAYLRACALRLECFYEPDAFRACTENAQWLLQKFYDHIMVDPQPASGVTKDQVVGVFLHDEIIERIHLGHETNGHGQSVDNPFKRVVFVEHLQDILEPHLLL
jgi:hypothetical protein